MPVFKSEMQEVYGEGMHPQFGKTRGRGTEWIAKANLENNKQVKIMEQLALHNSDEKVSQAATRKVKNEAILKEIIDSQYDLERIKIAIGRINTLTLLESYETDDDEIMKLIATRISSMKGSSSKPKTKHRTNSKGVPKTSIDNIIASYAKQNPGLKTGAAEAKKVKSGFLQSEHAFGLTYYGNNLARLYVVRALILEAQKDEAFRSKVVRELPGLIKNGFPPTPLWTAIAYAHICDDFSSDNMNYYMFKSLSYSKDEAAFLYSGLKHWKTKDEDFVDYLEGLKQFAAQSGL